MLALKNRRISLVSISNLFQVLNIILGDFKDRNYRQTKRQFLCQAACKSPIIRFCTFFKLQLVLHSSKRTAPGPYGIHYKMLQYLHPSTLELVLYLFNRIWLQGCFPLPWKLAIIIPRLKPGKDPTCTSSFRPTALTSCFSKTLEKMIYKRLIFYLERTNLLDHYQCGFRSAESTVDYLVRFESAVREAFVNRKHCLSV